jgi:hypothetical protein
VSARIAIAVSVLIALLGFARFEWRGAVSPAPAPLTDAKDAKDAKAPPPPPDFSMTPTVDPASPFPNEISRRVLALYNGAEIILEDDEQTGRADANRRRIDPEVAIIHRLAELPLDHLGLSVDYQDVNRPLPGAAAMQRYRGVLAWFEDNHLSAPEAYLSWLAEQVDAGRRVVVIGDLESLQDSAGGRPNNKLVERALTALRGNYLGPSTAEASELEVVRADPGIIGFERPLPSRLEVHQRYRAGVGATAHLELIDNGTAIHPVWTSPTGGFVYGPLAYVEDRLESRHVVRWLINPFAFFERAFGLQGAPRFDFTTLNGRRIYYGHVDGDGLDTISEIDSKSRCGALVRDRIFKRYDLPFTASVVVGFTAPPPVGRGTTEDIAVARSIFALPNVEVGSHGFAHPMDWRAGEQVEVSVTELPNYVFGGEVEIKRSVEYINRELAPPDKPCRIMLWTGSCNPNEEQLSWAYAVKLRNLNGGDPRMDDHYPSYGHLVPPIHRVGSLFQYYSSAANDYILTEDWTPPYYRFENVLQTFSRSGSPRRVVPVNVYFHFYSARLYPALTALEHIFDWVLEQPLALLFASEYVDVARDFHWARLAEDGPRRWRVRKGSALRTVRFDDPELAVDLAESSHVLGWANAPELGATYVHLDGAPEALIALASDATEARRQARLELGSHFVDGAVIGASRIAFTTHGAGKKSFLFRGLPPNARYDGAPGARGPLMAGADGTLRLDWAAADQSGPITVRLDRELP